MQRPGCVFSRGSYVTNHFYILERLDRGGNTIPHFKHDNASGLQKDCVRVKAEDCAILRKTDVKPL